MGVVRHAVGALWVRLATDKQHEAHKPRTRSVSNVVFTLVFALSWYLFICYIRRGESSCSTFSRIDSRMGRWMAAAGPLPRPTATDRSGGVATGAVTSRSCHRRCRSTRSASAASCHYSRHLPSHAAVLCRRPRTPPRCPRSRPAAVLHAPTGSCRSRSRTGGLRLPDPRPHAPWRLQRSPPSVRRAQQRSAHRTPAWAAARTRRRSTARCCTGT